MADIAPKPKVESKFEAHEVAPEPRAPIDGPPAVMHALARAKGRHPDADPVEIDDAARKTMSGRVFRDAGDIAAWERDFDGVVRGLKNVKKG